MPPLAYVSAAIAVTSMHRPANVWIGTSGQRRLTVAIDSSA